MTFNVETLSFMTKVKPNNGNEIKSVIFSWDIFKYDVMLFCQKILKIFQ